MTEYVLPTHANAYGNVPRPALRYFANHNPLQVFDFGPGYRAGDSSGVISIEPPKPGAQSYGIVVPQADADGADTSTPSNKSGSLGSSFTFQTFYDYFLILFIYVPNFSR